MLGTVETCYFTKFCQPFHVTTSLPSYRRGHALRKTPIYPKGIRVLKKAALHPSSLYDLQTEVTVLPLKIVRKIAQIRV